jgi:hypothetical protein
MKGFCMDWPIFCYIKVNIFYLVTTIRRIQIFVFKKDCLAVKYCIEYFFYFCNFKVTIYITTQRVTVNILFLSVKFDIYIYILVYLHIYTHIYNKRIIIEKKLSNIFLKKSTRTHDLAVYCNEVQHFKG